MSKPWVVHKFSKPQPSPYYVARELLVDESNSHFEQLRDPATGGCARFETEEEAAAAIASFEQVAA